MIKLIYPHDDTLVNVENIAGRLKSELGYNIQVNKIEPTKDSVSESLHFIAEATTNDVLFFMGHGTSFGLMGPKGDAVGHPDLDEKYEEIDKDAIFNSESFISEKNWNILSGKNFIGYACKSAEWLIKTELKSGVGFGILPSTTVELSFLCLPEATQYAADQIVEILDNSMYLSIIDINLHGFDAFRFREVFNMHLNYEIARLFHETRENAVITKALAIIQNEARIVVS